MGFNDTPGFIQYIRGGYSDDTSNDGSCILWICLTMRSNEFLSPNSNNEPSECDTSNWTGYTKAIEYSLSISCPRSLI